MVSSCQELGAAPELVIHEKAGGFGQWENHGKWDLIGFSWVLGI